MIMEADKSRDLQSASWILRRADSANASRLETQEEALFQLESEGREKFMSQQEERPSDSQEAQSAFLFYSDLQRIG